MNPTLIWVAVAAVLLAAGVPLYFWQRKRNQKNTEMLTRACQFCLDRYDSLLSPKFQLITEYRLRVALKHANAEDAEVLNFIIANQHEFGHPIDTYVETVTSGTSGMPPHATTVTTHIYGISRADLRRLQHRLRRS